MGYQKLMAAALMIPMIAVSVQAEVVAGRWEKMESLAPGTAVIVDLRGGEHLECTFNKIGLDEILFHELNGKERRLPKNAVLKIETAGVAHDRLRNGILIGALMGAAGGIAGMVAYGNSTTDGPIAWNDEDGPAYLLGGALVGGGIGAATGAIIDASIKHREVLYKAK